MAPLVLLDVDVTDPKARDTKHGRVVVVWVEATIRGNTGKESTAEFPVWWLEAEGAFVIAGRPSRWIGV